LLKTLALCSAQIIFLALPLFAQTTVVVRPDCFLPLGTVTNGNTGASIATFDNRSAGCSTWVFSYDSFTFSAVSLVVQTAPNAPGDIPGAWSTFTPVAGINPNTSTTSASSTFGGQASFFPWVRVFFTSATGAGTIRGVLYGCKNPASCGIGATATIAQPVQVDGPTAAGSAATTPPVLTAGQDGAPGVIRVFLTDSSGRSQINVAQYGGTAVVNGGVTGSVGVGGLTAAGAAVAGNSVRIGGTDGGGLKRDILTDTAGHLNVVGAVTVTGIQSVQGIATNNTNVGAATSLPVIPCVANAAPQTWTEGFNVDCSTDLKGNLRTTIAGNATMFSGQQAVTNAAAALATNTVKNICVKALSTNTASVFIGPSGVTTATGLELAADDSYCGPVTNTNLIFVIAAAGGSTVSWFAQN
jgi:hypothetical protein